MKLFKIIEVSEWVNGDGVNYTNTIEKLEVSEKEKDIYKDTDWNAVIGLDNFTPDEWCECHEYDTHDFIWVSAWFEINEETGEEKRTEIEKVYESEVVKSWME